MYLVFLYQPKILKTKKQAPNGACFLLISVYSFTGVCYNMSNTM
jgi:hypothetical protein